MILFTRFRISRRLDSALAKNTWPLTYRLGHEDIRSIRNACCQVSKSVDLRPSRKPWKRIVVLVKNSKLIPAKTRAVVAWAMSSRDRGRGHTRDIQTSLAVMSGRAVLDGMSLKGDVTSGMLPDAIEWVVFPGLLLQTRKRCAQGMYI